MAASDPPNQADFTNPFKQLEIHRRMVASWLLSSEMRLKFVLAIAPRFSLTLVCSFMRRARALVSDLKVVMVMQSSTPDGRQAQAL